MQFKHWSHLETFWTLFCVWSPLLMPMKKTLDSNCWLLYRHTKRQEQVCLWLNHKLMSKLFGLFIYVNCCIQFNECINTKNNFAISSRCSVVMLPWGALTMTVLSLSPVDVTKENIFCCAHIKEKEENSFLSHFLKLSCRK